MATNIEMNILKADGNYDTLYPKTLGSLVNGAVASATNATTATKLQTGRTIRTNLGSASSATFDGSSDITPGITGTLSTSYGGTSANSAPGGLYNLIAGCSARTASQVNSYASSTYLGAYYSTTGYRIAISNLLTYFQNNLSNSSGVKSYYGKLIGSGSAPDLTIPSMNEVLFFMAGNYNKYKVFGVEYYTHFLIWYKISTEANFNTSGLVIHATENTNFFMELTGDADMIGNTIVFRNGGGKITPLYASNAQTEYIVFGK